MLAYQRAPLRRWLAISKALRTPLTNSLMWGIVTLGLLAFALNHWDYLKYCFQYKDFLAPTHGRFGDSCETATGPWQPGSDFDAIASGPHQYVKTIVPFYNNQPRIIVPAGYYLIARCILNLQSLPQEGFAQLVLRRMTDAAVYLNGRKIIEVGSPTSLSYPVPPAERLPGVELVAIWKNSTNSIASLGWAAPNQIPFFTSDVQDLQRLHQYSTNDGNYYRIVFGACFALLLIFLIMWSKGLRFADVRWSMLALGAIMIGGYARFLPRDDILPLGVSLFRLANGLAGLAIIFFAIAFCRPKNSQRLVFAFTLIMGSIILSRLLASKDIRTVNFIEVDLFDITSAVGWIFVAIYTWRRASEKSKRRRMRLKILSFLALSSAILRIGCIYENFTNNWTIFNQLWMQTEHIILLAFAAFVADDIVTYFQEYYTERERRIALEKKSDRAHAIALAAQMIAHDIRRPFSTVLTAAKQIAKSSDHIGIKTTAERLLPEIERTSTSIESMLSDIMMLDSSLRLSLRNVSARSIVESAIKSVYSTHPDLRQRIIIDIRQNTAISCDQTKIERVLVNIIDNAIAATQAEEKITVSVTLASIPNYVSFSVHNTGSHIVPDDQEQIFEPFFTKGKAHGTGLGLALAQQIIEAHGSRINLTSNSSNGTTFTWLLPTVETSPIRTHLPVPAFNKVIIVEDNAFILEAWKDAINAQNVYCFDSPRAFAEAVALPGNHLTLADLVITDYFFDSDLQTGRDVLELTRRMLPNIHVVLMTDHISPDPSGFDLVIGKQPMSIDELALRIRSESLGPLADKCDLP